jgi:hypothetical protein
VSLRSHKTCDWAQPSVTTITDAGSDPSYLHSSPYRISRRPGKGFSSQEKSWLLVAYFRIPPLFLVTVFAAAMLSDPPSSALFEALENQSLR